MTQMSDFYHWLYEKRPLATLEQVEDVIVNGGNDCDGISQERWIEELKSEDMVNHLLVEIIQNKHNPAYKSLYGTVEAYIQGILDY